MPADRRRDAHPSNERRGDDVDEVDEEWDQDQQRDPVTREAGAFAHNEPGEDDEDLPLRAREELGRAGEPVAGSEQ